MKKNMLLEKVLAMMKDKKKGRLLDLGCGQGAYAAGLHALGFDVTAADLLHENFRFHKKIRFCACDLSRRLPFGDESFDYVLFLEVIEHLEKPFEVIAEINRVLKPGGSLILSTPNILNIGSRFRFLCEGCFDFYREPLLDYRKIYPGAPENLHITVWRYHELEYMLHNKGFQVERIDTDSLKAGLKPLYFFLSPILKIHNAGKEARSRKKGGVDYRRINRILFSKEMLFGKHLILEAVKK